jgi:hypothetical protein
MICAFLLGYTTGEATGGLPGADADADELMAAVEFDADLDDLVQLVAATVAAAAVGAVVGQDPTTLSENALRLR